MDVMKTNSEMDLQTRINMARETTKTNLPYTVAAGLTAGMALSATESLIKQPNQDKFVKVIDKAATKTGKGLAKLFPKLEPKLKTIGKKFAELPGWAKVSGAIALAAGTIINSLLFKIAFNDGKIQQKYEDLAMLKNNEK